MKDTNRHPLRQAVCVALLSLCSGIVAAPADAAPAEWRGAVARSWQSAHLQARPAATPTSVAAPQIVSGKILTPKVNVRIGSATPEYHFVFNAPGYYSSNTFIFTGPSGQTVYQDYGVPPPGPEKTGGITFADLYGGFTIYSEPGIWTLTSASISDLARQYDQL